VLGSLAPAPQPRRHSVADIRTPVPEELERDLCRELEFVVQYLDGDSLKELRWSPHSDRVHTEVRVELQPELVVLDHDYDPNRPDCDPEHAKHEVARIPLEKMIRLEFEGVTWYRDSSGTLRRFSPE